MWNRDIRLKGKAFQPRNKRDFQSRLLNLYKETESFFTPWNLCFTRNIKINHLVPAILDQNAIILD